VPVPGAAQSKVWVSGRSLVVTAVSNSAGGMDLSLVKFVCFQVQLSAANRSLVQRSITECLSLSVVMCDNKSIHVQRVCRNRSE
jgi:hypothetical protein